MNPFDDITIDSKAFSYRDLTGQDKWTAWTPVFTSLTVIGATAYTARYRINGKQCSFQVQFSAATSIASTAGTTYLALPFTAKGLNGIAVMTNGTTNVAVGVCHIDVANSRCYLPTQLASGNVFHACGSFEI